MPATRIKICGITRAQDAKGAAAAGAHALGLVFYPPSPRAVATGQAREIAAAVPPFVTLVGLFVDMDAAQIRKILRQVPLGLLQFHGSETPQFCRAFERPWIKTVHLQAGTDLAAAGSSFADASGILLDTYRKGVPGGTGETFDWRLAQQRMPLPVVLAGGLNEVNVGAAIAQIRPSAVDVSSAVESAPGIKDVSKILRFVAAVRHADASLEGNTDDE